MDYRIIEVVKPGIGRIRDLTSPELHKLSDSVWVLVDGVALTDVGPEGEIRLRTAIDALEAEAYAKLIALLGEFGDLVLEDNAAYFRRKNEIWEVSINDPNFSPENTFTSVADLQTSVGGLAAGKALK